ncbi:unnamed protein product, partial [Lymnaea stagnalis]
MLSRCRLRESLGGPSISSLIPSEKFLNMYAWVVPQFQGDPDAEHFVSIVIKGIFIRWLAVTGASTSFIWTKTDGDSEWSVGRRRTTSTAQEATTQNGACFAVYIYGHTWKTTYQHPVGYSVTNICPACLETV